MQWQAALPEDMQAVLAALRQQNTGYDPQH
jgi:hypothetical protein